MKIPAARKRYLKEKKKLYPIQKSQRSRLQKCFYIRDSLRKK